MFFPCGDKFLIQVLLFRPPLTPPNLGGEIVSSPPKFLPCKRPSAERGGVLRERSDQRSSERGSEQGYDGVRNLSPHRLSFSKIVRKPAESAFFFEIPLVYAHFLCFILLSEGREMPGIMT